MAKSVTERMKAMRERKKLAGQKDLKVMLPGDYKERFDRLCRQLRTTAAETICYLIDLATDKDEDDEV